MQNTYPLFDLYKGNYIISYAVNKKWVSSEYEEKRLEKIVIIIFFSRYTRFFIGYL